MPVMVGARLVDCTVIVKGASDAVACPSLTVIAMLPKMPALAAVVAPASRPVLGSNVAHAGRFETANVSASPSKSTAVGVKE